jgi:hypothetical protein
VHQLEMHRPKGFFVGKSAREEVGAYVKVVLIGALSSRES